MFRWPIMCSLNNSFICIVTLYGFLFTKSSWAGEIALHHPWCLRRPDQTKQILGSYEFRVFTFIAMSHDRTTYFARTFVLGWQAPSLLPWCPALRVLTHPYNIHLKSTPLPSWSGGCPVSYLDGAYISVGWSVPQILTDPVCSTSLQHLKAHLGRPNTYAQVKQKLSIIWAESSSDYDSPNKLLVLKMSSVLNYLFHLVF